jgi:tetraacyldisaccharide-1-P 4'-kinase
MSAALHDAARRLWAGEMGVRGSALGAALAPAAAAYRLGVAARNRAYDAGLLPAWHAGIPVVSVGNIAVGGTGKTPFAHWLAVQLRARGRTPAILHGGYAADEPALHRRWAADIAVVVGRDRVHGAQQARAGGADVLVLDDGFQHRRLHRDLDIVLVAAERWQGASARLLPRGPWREPVTALRRATLVVVTRKTATEQAAQQVAADVAAVLGRADGPSVLRVHLRAGEWRRDGARGSGAVAAGTAGRRPRRARALRGQRPRSGRRHGRRAGVSRPPRVQSRTTPMPYWQRQRAHPSSPPRRTG